ncbi:MAG: Hsp33 family molecular chaperone HslO [Gammaproteobacteria bacterium]
MRQRDTLHRFVFEHFPVRGEIAHLDATWRTVLERRSYPSPVRQVLGEALAATALLHATIKFNGLLTLQMQGDGPLYLVVVQCTSAGNLRALARWRGAVPEQKLAGLMGAGTLTITLDPAEGERYQGIVELGGITLTAALERYFEQSEQLPTRLRLASDEYGAAGMLLQRLPGELPEADTWNRIEMLGASLSAPELLTLNAKDILHRLFNEDDVRLFSAQSIGFRCTCSRERTGAMLTALGQEEVRAIIAEQGQVEVKCEFCGQNYRFDAVDAAGLFAHSAPAPGSETRH